MLFEVLRIKEYGIFLNNMNYVDVFFCEETLSVQFNGFFFNSDYEFFLNEILKFYFNQPYVQQPLCIVNSEKNLVIKLIFNTTEDFNKASQILIYRNTPI